MPNFRLHGMPRKGRVVIPNIPHHVTQRGVRKQDVFFSPADRRVYLELLAENAPRFGAELLAYTLMTNHVHHLIVPREKDSLRWTFQVTHRRYAEYVNTQYSWTGHLWQARFYSAPVDDTYFWVAVRYIHRNPVEARLVAHASDHTWSSAGAHCGGQSNKYIVTDTPYARRLARRSDWLQWLAKPEHRGKIACLRANTFRDLPIGSKDFLDALERDYGVVAHPPKMGRPKKGVISGESRESGDCHDFSVSASMIG